MSSFDPIDPALIDTPSPEIALSPDGHPGYTLEMEQGDTTDAIKDCCGAASREFPESMWIEPSKWEEASRENDENKTWPINYIDRFTNQNPTHECTCHSLSRAVEGCRNRQRGIIFPDGPKKGFRYPESVEGSVWVSPLSVYAEANPRKTGGANVRQVMEIACRRGMLPEKIQPKEYGFKHTLQGTTGQGNSNQSRGDWVPVSNFPEGWQETAKLFKPLEVIFPESLEQAVCLVLHGYLVCVGRNGHAIPWGIWGHVQKTLGYPDSYDVMRYDSWRTAQSAWRGSFAIASVTTPDDWLKPGV